MCAATVRFISNNDNHSAEEHTKKVRILQVTHTKLQKKKRRNKNFCKCENILPEKEKNILFIIQIQKFSLRKKKKA